MQRRSTATGRMVSVRLAESKEHTGPESTPVASGWEGLAESIIETAVVDLTGGPRGLVISAKNRREAAVFLGSGWFENLAYLAGVEPETLRKPLCMVLQIYRFVVSCHLLGLEAAAVRRRLEIWWREAETETTSENDTGRQKKSSTSTTSGRIGFT